MTAIIKTRHRVRSAKDFLENFDGHPELTPGEGAHKIDRNHYLFVGKADPWPTDLLADPPVSEERPPIPEDNIISDYRAWDKMLALKKITRANASLVIPRHDWDATGKTVYAQYDPQDVDLYYHPTPQDAIDGNTNGYTPGALYTITDEFHVFKCLSNNSGAKSTDKPTLPGSAPYIVETADGYKWKYMYTLTPGDVTKFYTDEWIPVKTLTTADASAQWQVQSSAISGSIDSVIIDDVGSGYEFVQVGAVMQGAGTSTAILNNDAIATNSHATVAFPGNSIYITGGTGFPQEPRKIVSYDHTTQTAVLDAPWAGTQPDNTTTYDLYPTATISGDGINATAKVIINTTNNEIERVLTQNVGQDYTFATVSLEGGLAVGGVHGQLRVGVAPTGGHGSDPENELGGYFVMLVTVLKDEEDLTSTNNYRQVGIIRDVRRTLDGNLALEDTLRATKKLVLTGYSSGIAGDFQPDEQISSSNATARIVDFIDLGSGNAELTYWQDGTTGFDDFQVADVLVGSITGAGASVSSIEDREAVKNSGDLIYIEHRRQVQRDIDQQEDVKVILEW